MVSLHVACCFEVGGDLFEQPEGCFVVAGLKRFDSILLRLVCDCGEEGACHRDLIFLTFRGELSVGEASRYLVVDVKISGFRWGEV